MFKKLFNNEAGVSPIVATLVLVVVAIAGAAAVGTIMGSFSSEVSDSASADDAAASSSTELLIAGSTTVQPVSELLAKAYMAEHGGVKVTVQAGGSSAGIAAAGLDTVDIGAASKFVPTSSLEKFPELETHTIGGSAVVVVRNNVTWTSSIVNISTTDLKALYDDNASTVYSAGPSDLVVYQRTEGSGTEETLAKYLSLGDDVDDQVANTGSTTVLANKAGNQAVMDAIADDDDPAIGFVDYGFAKASQDDGDAITILAIDTLPAVTSDNVKAEVKAKLSESASPGKYEDGLCRPLNYITNGAPSSVEGSFIQFSMSPESIKFFEDCGYWSIVELQ
jgi:phosphate transport system substrate-binding protein